MVVECPSCKRTDFESRRGMKQHHARTHGVALGRETTTLTCENCGDSYNVREDNADQSRFCSADCLYLGRKSEGRSETSSSCEWCESSFTHHPSRDRRFCSQGCHRSWLHGEHLTGDDSPLANKVERTCDECGTSFTRQQSRAELNDRDYCSQDCYFENHTGEDAPNWKGGSLYYGEGWRDARRRALDRDDYECQDCGLTRDEHYGEFGYDLEVHHIEPFRTFDDATDANQLTNLITLCTTCHIEHEHSTD